MAGNKKHSIEERVEDWCKQQFKGQKYYTKTESINSEIEEALRKAPSKKGGTGTNFPDIGVKKSGRNKNVIRIK